MIYGTIFGKKYRRKYANEQKKTGNFHPKIYVLNLNVNKKGIEIFNMENRRFKIESLSCHGYPSSQYKLQWWIGMDNLEF